MCVRQAEIRLQNVDSIGLEFYFGEEANNNSDKAAS